MELRELSKKEFDNYALNHPFGSFQQTSFWGGLWKEINFTLIM